ncbi:TetR/AcrR family transcriptional regulator [Deinococcus aquaedulcis]|uniref:TetR/AcrR family transcriptional regulator n=1 Tax=Deinococcus aquaedulcis TaxID=2840455 RepID=UPI001C834673|nr:TetR/AcrR family transcriptional regulator [Deinococcus aquaedulcis]
MSTHSEEERRERRSTRAAPRPPADPERRAAILAAAQEAFAQKGFHRTTMRDVARAAGLAEGTLYNHFQNKDALLLGLFDALGEQTRAALDPHALAGADLRTFLRTLLAAPLGALAGENFALFRVIVSEALVRPELGRQFAAGLAQTAQLGAQALAARTGADTPLLHTGLTLVLGRVLEQALSHEPPGDAWARLPDELTDTLLRTLGPDHA